MDERSFMGLLPLVVGLVVCFVIFGIPIMQIAHKAGYSRAWVIVMFIPLVNLIMLWVFAFARWPRLAGAYSGAQSYAAGQQFPGGAYPGGQYTPPSQPTANPPR